MTTKTEDLKTTSNQDHTIILTLDATPHQVFKNINDVTRWWTENLEGGSKQLGDEFTVRFRDMHITRQKVVELVPDKKMVWLITESELNFLENKQEWKGTKVSFEISNCENKTRVKFTHFGLVPDAECYSQCVKGWNYYIQESLSKLLTEGEGKPDLKSNN